MAIRLLGAAVAYIFYLIRCKPGRQVLELHPGNPGGKPGENGKEIKVRPRRGIFLLYFYQKIKRPKKCVI